MDEGGSERNRRASVCAADAGSRETSGENGSSETVNRPKLLERAATSSIAALSAALTSAGVWVQDHVIPLAGTVTLGVLAWLLGPAALARWRERRLRNRLAAGQACAHDATVLYQQMLETLNRTGKPLTPFEHRVAILRKNMGGRA